MHFQIKIKIKSGINSDSLNNNPEPTSNTPKYTKPHQIRRYQNDKQNIRRCDHPLRSHRMRHLAHIHKPRANSKRSRHFALRKLVRGLNFKSRGRKNLWPFCSGSLRPVVQLRNLLRLRNRSVYRRRKRKREIVSDYSKRKIWRIRFGHAMVRIRNN